MGALERGTNERETGHRVAECSQLAWGSASGCCFPTQSLDVANAIERFAQGRANEWITKRLYRAESRFDRLSIDERSEQPLPQQPRSHRCQRSVQYAEQRPRYFPSAHGLDELEVSPRHLVERHCSIRALDSRAAEVRRSGRL